MEAETPLFKAVEENDLNLIIQYASLYAGMRDKDGYTALHRAILSQKLECTVTLAPYERTYLTPAGISPIFLAESTGFFQAIGCLQDSTQDTKVIMEKDYGDLVLRENVVLDHQLALLKELIDTRAELELARSWNDELQQSLIKRNAICTVNNANSTYASEQSFINIDACVICLDRPREIVYLPCRHFVICEKCFTASQLRTCPLCRSPIIDTIVVLR